MDMDMFDDLLPRVLNNRYLYERLEKPKSRHFIQNILPHLPEEDFKQEYRMFRNSFDAILARIRGHPIFHTSDSTGRPQEDPEFQLQVALKRFGTEGSTASSVNAIARHFGCGAGTVLLYTKRVVIALMSLWKEVVSWKSKQEKREMRDRIREKGFEVFF
jgi:hypothetical protein